MFRFILVLLLILILLLSVPTVLERVLPLSFSELIVYYGNKSSIDPALLAAVIYVESSFRPEVVSSKGAVGLMQLMPSTAQWLASQRGEELEEQVLLEPERNIELGSYYLQYLLERFPTEHAALAAYNGGPTNARRWLEEGMWDGSWEKTGGIPFAETRMYVRRVGVLRHLYRFFYNKELQS